MKKIAHEQRQLYTNKSLSEGNFRLQAANFPFIFERMKDFQWNSYYALRRNLKEKEKEFVIKIKPLTSREKRKRKVAHSKQ